MESFKLESGITGLQITTGTRSKPPILFIHGMWLGAWYFKEWMKYANNEGHPVYALNLRGHHDSRPGGIGRITFNDYLADIEEVIRYIERKPILVGHSLGGLLTQILALENFAVKAVLIAPTPPSSIMLQGPIIWAMLQQFTYFFDMLLGRPLQITYQSAVDLLLNNISSDHQRKIYEALVPESGTVARQVVFRQINAQGPMPCPSLVVTASRDRMILESIGIKIAQRYNSEFMNLPDNGHMMMLEDGSQTVIKHIFEEFIDSNPRHLVVAKNGSFNGWS